QAARLPSLYGGASGSPPARPLRPFPRSLPCGWKTAGGDSKRPPLLRGPCRSAEQTRSGGRPVLGLRAIAAFKDQVASGLCGAGGGEDQALVILQRLQPAFDIGGGL